MLESPVFVVTLILALVAAGEVISILTRAYVPALLVTFMGYLILLWTGVLDPTVVPGSALSVAGAVLVGAVITHMGTLIPVSHIREQYKAILIALGGVAGAAILILGVVTLVFDYGTAVAGAGPVTGGIIATLLTTEALQERGLETLIVIPALILGLQSLIGMPVTNILLRRYAIRVRDRLAVPQTASAGVSGTDAANPAGGVPAASTSTDAPPAEAAPAPAPRRALLQLPERFQEPPIVLLLLFVSASIATVLDELTGVNYGIYCLLLGVLGQVTGILPRRSMDKANSFGFGMISVVVVVLASMSSVTWEDVSRAIVPVLVILLVGTGGVMIGGAIVSKLVRWHPTLGMPVALTALYGFPGDYVLVQEVARSVGRDEKEQLAIRDQILTPMLVGGFATVTTSSILVASILVSTL